MFKNLFKKKEQAKAPDVTMTFEIPEDLKRQIDVLDDDGHAAKLVFRDWLKTLNRAQFLCVCDTIWYKEHTHTEWFWEAYNDEEWEREWPMGKHTYESRIPDIVMDTIPLEGLDKKNPIDLPQLVKQVEGIQKKLDRVLKIIENTEVTMSAKTALKM